MNTTKLTQAQLMQDYFDCENLKELVAEIEKKMQANGEVVCQLVLNGMVLNENDELRLSQILLEEVNELEIRTEKPSALLFGVLKNWSLEIPKIVEQVEGIAASIRIKGIESQAHGFVQMVDSCQFLVDSLVSMDSVLLIEEFVSREIWIQCEKQLTQAIGEALESFERKDLTLLADVLEYDLANSLQSWFDLLKDLEEKLQEANQRDSGGLTERIFKKSSP